VLNLPSIGVLAAGAEQCDSDRYLVVFRQSFDAVGFVLVVHTTVRSGMRNINTGVLALPLSHHRRNESMPAYPIAHWPELRNLDFRSFGLHTCH
jgi:hypothetical protein